MSEEIIVISSANVQTALGMFLSNKIICLRDKLAVTSITKREEVVRLCAEILECYKIVEKNEFILSERSKNYES